jgi:hypothetical protein
MKKDEITKVEEELSALTSEFDAAKEQTERLQSERKSILLNGSDDDLRRHDEQLARSQRAQERAEARRADCERRLETARAEKAAAEFEAMQKEADSAADAAAAAIRKALSGFHKVVRSITEQVEAADRKVASFNRASENSVQLNSVAARAFADWRLAYEVLQESEIVLWSYELSGDPIPEAQQHEVVVTAEGIGRLPSNAIVGASSAEVVQRKFIKREFLKEDTRWYPADLEDALKELARLTDLSQEDNRKPQIELIPVRDTAVA